MTVVGVDLLNTRRQSFETSKRKLETYLENLAGDQTPQVLLTDAESSSIRISSVRRTQQSGALAHAPRGSALQPLQVDAQEHQDSSLQVGLKCTSQRWTRRRETKRQVERDNRYKRQAKVRIGLKLRLSPLPQGTVANCSNGPLLQSQVQALQAELAQAQQAIKILRSNNDQLSRLHMALPAQACVHFPVNRSLNWQVRAWQSSLTAWCK